MPEMNNSTTRYFSTYSGVKLPFKLTGKLEESAIANRNTYFKGAFDAKGRLLGFQKVVYGEIEMEHRYEYHPNGALKQAEIINIEDETNLLQFDETGRPL